MNDAEIKQLFQEFIGEIAETGISKRQAKPKFSHKEKREITELWNKYFPDMGFIKIYMLARIVGPIVIKVSMRNANFFGAGYKADLSITNYATVHEFNFPGFLDALETRYVSYTGDPVEAIIRQKEVFNIRTEGQFTLEDITNYYNGHITANRCSPMLVAAWAGEEKVAKKMFDEYAEYQSQINYKVPEFTKYDRRLRKHVLDEEHMAEYDRKYNPEALIEKMWYQVSNPEILRENAIRDINILGLGEAPYQDIVGAKYREEYWHKRA
ncbi:MAG: hypothetical protein Tsb006_7240 [Rickettsiaceae bacterium]